MRSEEDIALDRTLVFHYDPVHRVVIKQEMPPLTAEEEEEMVQQQLAASESRRKRPQNGNYELPFPERRRTRARGTTSQQRSEEESTA